jgi:hypothetical protein
MISPTSTASETSGAVLVDAYAELVDAYAELVVAYSRLVRRQLADGPTGVVRVNIIGHLLDRLRQAQAGEITLPFVDISAALLDPLPPSSPAVGHQHQMGNKIPSGHRRLQAGGSSHAERMVRDGIVPAIGDDDDGRSGLNHVGQDVLRPGIPVHVDNDDVGAAPVGHVGQRASMVGIEKADGAPSEDRHCRRQGIETRFGLSLVENEDINRRHVPHKTSPHLVAGHRHRTPDGRDEVSGIVRGGSSHPAAVTDSATCRCTDDRGRGGPRSGGPERTGTTQR